MGKRKVESTVVKESPLPNRRKHRKNKNSGNTDDDSVSSISNADTLAEFSGIQPAIKLKIKIGGSIVGNSRFSVTRDEQDSFSTTADEIYYEDDINIDVSADSDSIILDSARLADTVDSSADDEEQEWLNALESGDLDDNGELKRKRDLSILTARQRALLHGQQIEELLELPTMSKRSELMTEEQLNRRQLRAKRRKEKAQEKTEKDKKETLDRLLKKQDSKAKNQQKSGRRDGQREFPVFTYSNSLTSISVSVPTGFDFPLTAQKASQPPRQQFCGATGCTNMKKYSCSRTGIPLCSLQCYRTNLAILGQSENVAAIMTT